MARGIPPTRCGKMANPLCNFAACFGTRSCYTSSMNETPITIIRPEFGVDRGIATRVRELIERPGEKLTDYEIGKEVGTSTRYVTNVRKRWEKKHGRPPGRPKGRLDSLQVVRKTGTPQKLNQILEELNHLPEDARRRALEDLVINGEGAVRVSAVKALNEMQREKGEGVGPPPPTTPNECVARIKAMLLASDRVH